MNVHATNLGFGPLVKPEDVGFSSERLARIRPALELEVAEKRIPGAVVMIARRDVLAHIDAIGARDPASGTATTASLWVFTIRSWQSHPPISRFMSMKISMENS